MPLIPPEMAESAPLLPFTVHGDRGPPAQLVHFSPVCTRKQNLTTKSRRALSTRSLKTAGSVPRQAAAFPSNLSEEQRL